MSAIMSKKTDLGERPSLGFATCDFVSSCTVTVAVEFLRDVDLTVDFVPSFSPRLSPPSDILFLFVVGRGRSNFLVSSFASVLLFFTAFFCGSRSEVLRLVEVEGETVSFLGSVPWSFFQLLERLFNSIPRVSCVSKHHVLEGGVCDEKVNGGSRIWREEDLIAKWVRCQNFTASIKAWMIQDSIKKIQIDT